MFKLIQLRHRLQEFAFPPTRPVNRAEQPDRLLMNWYGAGVILMSGPVRKVLNFVGNLPLVSDFNLRQASEGRISKCRTASQFRIGQSGSPRQIPRSLTASLRQSFSANRAILSATSSETGRSVGMTNSPFISEVGPVNGMSEFGIKSDVIRTRAFRRIVRFLGRSWRWTVPRNRCVSS